MLYAPLALVTFSVTSAYPATIQVMRHWCQFRQFELWLRFATGGAYHNESKDVGFQSLSVHEVAAHGEDDEGKDDLQDPHNEHPKGRLLDVLFLGRRRRAVRRWGGLDLLHGGDFVDLEGCLRSGIEDQGTNGSRGEWRSASLRTL